MKKTAWFIVGVFGVVGSVHLLLGISQSLAFGLLEQDIVRVSGGLDRYLLRRCAAHRKSAKTTAGNLGAGSYSVTDSASNEIYIGEKNWTGADRSIAEWVLITGGRIQAYDRRSGDAVVVMFTPEKIAFVDFARHRAGWYLREEPGARERVAEELLRKR